MTEVSPLTEAQQKFVAAIPDHTTAAETCPLESALGRTLATDVVAPTDMPPYHRAIVEGFLVNTAETRAAAEDSPVSFTIAGDIRPGDSQCPDISPGNAIRVATGSLVADGDYSIVRMWEAQINGDKISITRPFPPRFFVEEQGCDMKRGDVAVAGGTDISPEDIGNIAGLGITEVSVCRAPRVTIFASGDEVIPYSDELPPGAIRDSNSIMLAAAVSEAGGVADLAGIMKDDFDAFVTAARAALSDADVLLIAGGTAVGGRDFISDLIKEIGELIIDGVPMRSGRPLIMGISNGKPIVCVAGHPPEALRGFRLFGAAAIDKLLGRKRELPVDTTPPQNPPQKK